MTYNDYLYECSAAGYDIRMDNIPVTTDDEQPAIDTDTLLIV